LEVVNYTVVSDTIRADMDGMFSKFLLEATSPVDSPGRGRAQHAKYWISLDKSKYEPAQDKYKCKEDIIEQLATWGTRGFQLALFQKGKENRLLSHTSMDTRKNRYSLQEVEEIANSYLAVVSNDHFYIIDEPTKLKTDKLIESLTAQVITALNIYINALVASSKAPLGDTIFRSQPLISKSSPLGFFSEYVLISNIPPKYKNTNEHKALQEEIISLMKQTPLAIDTADLDTKIARTNFLCQFNLTNGCALVKLKNRTWIGHDGDDMLYYHITKRFENRPTWKASIQCVPEGYEAWIPRAAPVLFTGTGTYRAAENEAAMNILRQYINELKIGPFLIFMNMHTRKANNSNKSEQVFIVITSRDYSSASSRKEIILNRIQPQASEGVILDTQGMLFQVYTEASAFNLGIPSDELFAVRNHVCIDGFDLQHTKRKILDKILTRMEPEQFRYIYMSKSKEKSTFGLCLAEGANTNYITEDLFAGMEAEGYQIAAKPYSMLPGKSEVEWYRYARDTIASWRQTPGKTNAGRGSGQAHSYTTPTSSTKTGTPHSFVDGFQTVHRKRTTDSYSDVLTQSQPSMEGSSLTSAAGGLNSASLNE
jgi:hypothetical protein